MAAGRCRALAADFPEPLMQAAADSLAATDGAPGCITTFYSYKGGTGRTMALANTACLLAESLPTGERVLVVDWDLEAPGLHRFFPPRLRSNDPSLDLGLDAGPGLIDLFGALSGALPAEPARSEDEADEATAAAIDALDWTAYTAPTEHAAIHILRAGRNDDGGYGRRVNTFDWEGLFRRAPGIYRAFAERLARDYRWVLIDSRTGVTDISGICTSLLPEKLVVVYTPNRQSLTGVRELVQQATAYRRASDDLRPLLVLPLPSRIEASMEKLRIAWRHGRPEAGIPGYQPMFESLLAECYGLAECRLGAYFDAVQIQQSPDCAYGEVISVVGGSADRFSLASSYRVFVERLVSDQPPWAEASAPASLERTTPDDAGEAAAWAAAAAASTFGRETGAPRASAAPVAGSAAFETMLPLPSSRRHVSGDTAAAEHARANGRRVFLSWASDDGARVAPVVQALEARGLTVFWDRTGSRPGQHWESVLADALDTADVIVVFWSQAALASESVRVEAEEGLRRGVLLPVLLDDARPPVLFRSVQAADLRRDFYRSHFDRLIDDIERIALAEPGDHTVIGPAYAMPPTASLTMAGGALASPASAPRSAAPDAAELPVNAPRAADVVPARRAGPLNAALGLVALLVFGIAAWALLRPLAAPPPPAPGSVDLPSTSPSPAPVAVDQPKASATAAVYVPDFTDRRTDVAGEIARSVRLKLVATDSHGKPLPTVPDGLVLAQTPAAGTSMPAGGTVTLSVATETSTVPSLAGLTLGDALNRLRASGLELGRVDTIEGSGGRIGSIVRQSPQAGAVVAAGEAVAVGVAGRREPDTVPRTGGDPDASEGSSRSMKAAKKPAYRPPPR